MSTRAASEVELSSTTRAERPCAHLEAFGGGPRPRPGAPVQADGEVEGAPLAGLALDPDAAAHQLDQAGGDREAEAGPAVVAGRRAVGLGERLEDAARASRAGCRCRCRRRRGGVRPPRRRPSPGSTCTTTSPRSVNLMALPTRLTTTWRSRPASPSRASGTPGAMSAGQLQALLVRPQGEGLHRVAQGVAEVELGRVEVELARLDLREVEQVVDHHEERLGRGPDDLEVLALVGLERRLQGELGHADDGVHRRADLVADVGQELALGLVGRLGDLLGLLELLLLPADPGARASDPAHRPAELGILLLARREVVEGRQGAPALPVFPQDRGRVDGDLAQAEPERPQSEDGAALRRPVADRPQPGEVIGLARRPCSSSNPVRRRDGPAGHPGSRPR